MRLGGGGASPGASGPAGGKGGTASASASPTEDSRDGTKDVTVTSCSLLPQLFSGVTTVSVTNSGTRSWSYWVTVGFYDEVGNELDETSADVRYVAPGSTRENTGHGSKPLNTARNGKVFCRIVSAERVRQ